MTDLLVLPSATPRYSSIIGRSIDNTALDLFMQCRRKYDFSMNQHFRNRSLTAALSYGGLWHKILETHYKTNGERAQVEFEAMLHWAPPEGEEDHRTLQRALLEYDNYIEKWGSPEDEAKRGLGRTVGVGPDAMIEIPFEVDLGVRHPYAGKIDRIYDLNGLYYVEDHKTCSQFGSNYYRQWELSNQMQGYAVGGWMVSGHPIAGVRINVHVIYKTKSVFDRGLISFSKERLQEWIRNYDQWCGEIERANLEKLYPANFNNCYGKYFRMCQYSGACAMSERYRQKALEQDFEVNAWNPLEIEDMELDDA